MRYFEKFTEQLPMIDGRPYSSVPRIEADDSSYADSDAFDGPDSVDVVDFDRDTSVPFLLGQLERLSLDFKDTMPIACKSNVRKAIAGLQKLVQPTTTAAVGESYRRRQQSEPVPYGWRYSLPPDCGSVPQSL